MTGSSKSKSFHVVLINIKNLVVKCIINIRTIKIIFYKLNNKKF